MVKDKVVVKERITVKDMVRVEDKVKVEDIIRYGWGKVMDMVRVTVPSQYTSVCFYKCLIFVFQSEMKSKNSSEFMESDLAGAKHELLRIRDMLEMAEKVKYCLYP